MPRSYCIRLDTRNRFLVFGFMMAVRDLKPTNSDVTLYFDYGGHSEGAESDFVLKESYSYAAKKMRVTLESEPRVFPVENLMSIRAFLNDLIDNKGVVFNKGFKHTVCCRLSTRDALILKYLAEGKSTREISQMIDITIKNISQIKRRLMSRLGLENKHELLLWVMHHPHVLADSVLPEDVVY
ncbi:helix-turn-helix transcriptional regulator [Enterobacteriaceae bacterium 4M9]|nr:helix-turn-helix transcriptional regulator [Enterobacteriaceae bacterium 4M9]